MPLQTTAGQNCVYIVTDYLSQQLSSTAVPVSINSYGFLLCTLIFIFIKCDPQSILLI